MSLRPVGIFVAAAWRLGASGLEAADLTCRFFLADGIAGLQLADQDLASAIDLLDVVVGQLVPMLLGVAYGPHPTFVFGPRSFGSLIHGRRGLRMTDRQRHRQVEDREHEGGCDQTHHRTQPPAGAGAATTLPRAGAPREGRHGLCLSGRPWGRRLRFESRDRPTFPYAHERQRESTLGQQAPVSLVTIDRGKRTAPRPSPNDAGPDLLAEVVRSDHLRCLPSPIIAAPTEGKEDGKGTHPRMTSIWSGSIGRCVSC